MKKNGRRYGEGYVANIKNAILTFFIFLGIAYISFYFKEGVKAKNDQIVAVVKLKNYGAITFPEKTHERTESGYNDPNSQQYTLRGLAADNIQDLTLTAQQIEINTLKKHVEEMSSQLESATLAINQHSTNFATLNNSIISLAGNKKVPDEDKKLPFRDVLTAGCGFAMATLLQVATKKYEDTISGYLLMFLILLCIGSFFLINFFL